jgi:hypothetical protein
MIMVYSSMVCFRNQLPGFDAVDQWSLLTIHVRWVECRAFLRSSVMFNRSIAVVFLFSCVAPAAAQQWKYEPTVQNCEIGYIMNILRQPKHKAVATTGGRPLGVHPTGCGFAHGHKSIAAAKKAALAECKKSASKLYPGECKVIEAQ